VSLGAATCRRCLARPPEAPADFHTLFHQGLRDT
jgi:hypothetical protein